MSILRRALLLALAKSNVNSWVSQSSKLAGQFFNHYFASCEKFKRVTDEIPRGKVTLKLLNSCGLNYEGELKNLRDLSLGDSGH